MTVFDIHVYFDTICPWVCSLPLSPASINHAQCYIGHKVFERAIELYQKTYRGGSKDEFKFTFLPYILNPNDPDQGISWNERVALKNGEERVNAIRTRLQRVGRANGIDFTFNSKIGKTRDSHRLIQFAPPESRKALLEEIFREHFEQDADITSHADLTKAAVAVGMDESTVMRFLQSGEGGEKVDSEAAQSRRDGISSVPTILINGRSVEGAEDASVFYETLIEAKYEQA